MCSDISRDKHPLVILQGKQNLTYHKDKLDQISNPKQF